MMKNTLKIILGAAVLYPAVAFSALPGSNVDLAAKNNDAQVVESILASANSIGLIAGGFLDDESYYVKVPAHKVSTGTDGKPILLSIYWMPSSVTVGETTGNLPVVLCESVADSINKGKLKKLRGAQAQCSNGTVVYEIKKE